MVPGKPKSGVNPIASDIIVEYPTNLPAPIANNAQLLNPITNDNSNGCCNCNKSPIETVAKGANTIIIIANINRPYASIPFNIFF